MEYPGRASRLQVRLLCYVLDSPWGWCYARAAPWRYTSTSTSSALHPLPRFFLFLLRTPFPKHSTTCTLILRKICCLSCKQTTDHLSSLVTGMQEEEWGQTKRRKCRKRAAILAFFPAIATSFAFCYLCLVVIILLFHFVWLFLFILLTLLIFLCLCSFGSALSYQVARRIRDSIKKQPLALFMMGRYRENSRKKNIMEEWQNKRVEVRIEYWTGNSNPETIAETGEKERREEKGGEGGRKCNIHRMIIILTRGPLHLPDPDPYFHLLNDEDLVRTIRVSVSFSLFAFLFLLLCCIRPSTPKKNNFFLSLAFPVLLRTWVTILHFLRILKCWKLCCQS